MCMDFNVLCIQIPKLRSSLAEIDKKKIFDCVMARYLQQNRTFGVLTFKSSSRKISRQKFETGSNFKRKKCFLSSLDFLMQAEESS